MPPFQGKSMRLTILFPLLLLAACDQAGSTAGPIEFDAARAWADLEHFVELGPRRIGTPPLAESRAYIRKQLEGLGWEFEEFPFIARAPEGARRKGEIQGVNLIARRKGTEAREIWFASHYDTFDRPRFVGANDGASSSAVLIELGRQLGGTVPRSGPGLVLCWFDGEEPFYPVPWDDENNSTFGSRALAASMKEDGSIRRIGALILLDMVGDKDLGVSIESLSTSWLRRIFERSAQAIGQPQLFVDRREIKDDHRPFLHDGVPCADLIDFRYGPSNRWWHTAEDTLDKCGAESLGTIGRVVLAALPRIEAYLSEHPSSATGG